MCMFAYGKLIFFNKRRGANGVTISNGCLRLADNYILLIIVNKNNSERDLGSCTCTDD